MRYVKIKAKTYNEAMMKLKMEHGDEAIPISHKYVKEGGLFKSKFLAKELVELTAAVPERNHLMKKKKELNSTIDFTVGEKDVQENAVVKPDSDDPGSCQRAVSPAQGRRKMQHKPPAAADDEEPVRQRESSSGYYDRSEEKKDDKYRDRLEMEFSELKKTLARVLEQQCGDAYQTRSSEKEDPVQMAPFKQILINNDFDRDECETMLEEVKNTISREDLKDKYKIEKSLKELLKSRIITSGPISVGNKKKIVMFIGPTGVGKTTSMAKLGAIYSLRENFNVTFLTIDTYRIAATEQLKKYAEIMRIPIHVVGDQKGFKEILDSQKSDIIMVDTSGRSHKNDLKISEIKSYADMVECDLEKILCVSANTKKADLEEVFKSFDKINFDSVIVTKVDETSSIGNVIEITERFKKPISYLTHGQEVPNDIDLADPDKIVNMIIGSAN